MGGGGVSVADLLTANKAFACFTVVCLQILLH